MKVSDKGAAFIASFEKEILHVYDDGYGYPTAGIGHRVNLPIGTVVTKEQSQAWFKDDLAKYGNAVDAGVKVHVSQNQFDALTSLCFNIGIGAFQKSSLLRKLNAGDYAGCAQGFASWNKSGGKVSKGLVRRRAAEIAIFHTPDLATAAPASSDAQNAPTIANPPTDAPPSPINSDGIFSRAWSKITVWKQKTDDVQSNVSGVSETLTNVTTTVAPISKISARATVAAKIAGYASLAAGFYEQHQFGIIVMLIGLGLVFAAFLYLHYSKERQLERQLSK